MQRGNIVLVALSGDYGKPRPAIVVQSNLFNPTHSSYIICPITSTLQNSPLYRITLEPSAQNGLKVISQIMVDKVQTINQKRVGNVIGYATKEEITKLNRSLVLILELA